MLFKKGQVIEAITSSYNLVEASGKLGIDRRSLLRLREKYEIIGLECKQKLNTEKVNLNEEPKLQLIDLFTPKYKLDENINEEITDSIYHEDDLRDIKLQYDKRKPLTILDEKNIEESPYSIYHEDDLRDIKLQYEQNKLSSVSYENRQIKNGKRLSNQSPVAVPTNPPAPEIKAPSVYRSANDIIQEMSKNTSKIVAKAQELGNQAAYILKDINTIASATIKKPSHLIIADLQVTPSSVSASIKTVLAIAAYANKMRPTKIVFLGDFWDMESIREYKRGDFDSVAYKADIKAGNTVMKAFQDALEYKPEQFITLGNHEQRIARVQKADKSVSAFISYEDFNLKDYNFTVGDYMQPLDIDGIFYCHYFTSGSMGQSIQSARMLLMKKHNNICQGHIQYFQQHVEILPNGRPITGLMAGSSYEHELDYLGKYQGTHYSRQIWYCSDVSNNKFNPERIGMEVIRSLV